MTGRLVRPSPVQTLIPGFGRSSRPPGAESRSENTSLHSFHREQDPVAPGGLVQAFSPRGCVWGLAASSQCLQGLGQMQGHCAETLMSPWHRPSASQCFRLERAPGERSVLSVMDELASCSRTASHWLPAFIAHPCSLEASLTHSPQASGPRGGGCSNVGNPQPFLPNPKEGRVSCVHGAE